jgi:ribosome-binding factor A
MSTTFRADRAGEAIRMTVARVLRQEVSDPRLEPITITAVEVTRDLGHAKIFYTVLGEEDAREAAQAGFESAAPFLRSRVGQEVPLRVVPELAFHYDRSTDNVMRLDEIFASLPELRPEGALPPVAVPPQKPMAMGKPRKRRK